MQKLFLWSIIIGHFCAPLHAQSISKYSLNLGSHTEFYNSVQVNETGGMRKFEFNPTIGGGLEMPVVDDFNFLTELNWVLPKKAGSSKIIKNLFMFRADFAYDPLDWFRLRLGSSVMWQNQYGQGGTAEVNNGNGTSTFYYPDESSSSLNNTFDLGAEGFFDQYWSVRLQTYVYSIFLEEKRQISYSLFLTYTWDR